MAKEKNQDKVWSRMNRLSLEADVYLWSLHFNLEKLILGASVWLIPLCYVCLLRELNFKSAGKSPLTNFDIWGSGILLGRITDGRIKESRG